MSLLAAKGPPIRASLGLNRSHKGSSGWLFSVDSQPFRDKLSRRALMAGAFAGAAARAYGRIGSVEFGVCEPAAHFEQAVAFGFDYYEPEASEIAAMDDGAFAQFKARVLRSPIRCKAFRSFIRSHKIVGGDVRPDDLHAYVNRTMARCREVGCEVMVFGSGGARNVPPGFPRERAMDQLRGFLRAAGDAARRHGMVIGIEQLRREESNVINTVGEALALAHEVAHPNVRIIVDYYHLRKTNENPDVMWKARHDIVHLHFANPSGRVWPKRPEEDPEYRHFFRIVREMNYRGGLTIEAPNGSMEKDAEASLRFFAEMLAG